MTGLAQVILIAASIHFLGAQKSTICNGGIYHDIGELIVIVGNCSYPYYIITLDCLKTSCPKLMSASLCPINSDKSLNRANIETTMKIVQSCLNETSICDFQINPIVMPSFTVAVDQLLVGTDVTGQCSLIKNTSVINNLKTTVISLTDNPDKAEFMINAPNISYDGVINCQFALPLQPVPLTLNNINYHGVLPMTATFSIFLKDDDLTPVIQTQKTKLDVDFNGFNRIPLLNNMHVGDIFTNFFEQYVDKSILPDLFANFIASVFSGAFAITKSQCS
ncbi:hypothetical protein CHUAL_007125 [Chamberlinius hualienensis]